MAKKFRKKPVVIEAMQWPVIYSNEERISERAQPMHDWMAGAFEDYWAGDKGRSLMGRIHTLEGEMTVSPGDWVIRGVAGEFYPCKPDIFEQTYEEVAE